MAETKVIVVQGGEELLSALSKLLGEDVVKQIQAQTGGTLVQGMVDLGDAAEEIDDAEEEIDDEYPECSCSECSCEEEVEEEPAVAFGTVVEDGSDEVSYFRSFDVTDAGDLDVRVTPQGVVINGETFDGAQNFTNTFAPNGAYDEVDAEITDENILTVRLVKVPEEGTEVEIAGWDF